MIDVPYTKHTLANGLQVIVHEDQALPIVAVNLWYHVGSKNEQPGRTGFAHLFEHLMFEGSQHHDRGYFEPLQDAGAAINGSTNTDRTNYWEVVPANALELALWMESDRMGYLLPALTPAKFETQRAVVLNERRQNYENRPYGLAAMALVAGLFPVGHPYHWPTIGVAEDLRAATVEEAAAFFGRYYHPANASLTLAGDVETDRALDLAHRYFGNLAAGPPVDPIDVDAPDPAGESRFLLEDRVELPRLYLGWRTPALFEPDDAELDLIADLLANGKTSRLYRHLVYQRRLAVDVAAGQSSRELGGFFQIMATAAPGVHLGTLEQEIAAEVMALATEGPDEAELGRGRAQADAHFIYRLQTIGGFNGKSDQLNAYNVLRGDPGYFDRDHERYRRATAESMRGAARDHLLNHRVAVSVVPFGRRDLALAESAPAAVA